MKPFAMAWGVLAALLAAVAVAQVPPSPLERRALSPQPLPPKMPEPTAAPARIDTPKTLAPTPARTTSTPPAEQGGMQTPARGDLYQMEDRAIIIVGGKPRAAGEIKKLIGEKLSKKAGPPKVVSSSSRKASVASAGAKSAAPMPGAVPAQTLQAAVDPRAAASRSLAQPASSGAASALARPPKSLAVATQSAPNVRDLKCLDKGPPAISDVSGPLVPGSKVAIHGLCLGDRPGHVEIIGQFPGGKLRPAFAAWDMTGVEVVIPADIRGASDHAVSITVVGADGRRSTAMQGQFLAARERIEVPASRWSPGANFELSSASDRMMSNNTAYAGQLARSVRVSPQCGLDTMEVTVLAGSVKGINGWEAGPANEASVVIDWQGTCVGQEIWSETDYMIYKIGDVKFNSACRVALLARAWAYCPVGVAP